MKQPSFRFGIGTKLSLVAAVGIVAYQWLNEPKQGDIESAKSIARNSVTPPPLRKPEPKELLNLNLTDAQRAEIVKIDAAWSQTKLELNEAIRGSIPDTSGKQSLNVLKSSMQDYSQLSRQFDAERIRHWEMALDVLSPEQRKEVSK
jgi:hypothetical protein